ncbi:hypothetical protein V8E36_007400 [Tilletia maclaganii]
MALLPLESCPPQMAPVRIVVEDAAVQDGDALKPKSDDAEDKQKKYDRQSRKPAESLSEHASNRGYLSVTDLVSLAWCEVQSLYGVLVGRNLPLDQRPTQFTTKTGAVIVPDREIAVEREKTLEKGRAIHAELEKELYAEQVVIPTETPGDKWALRILEVCCGLKNLLNDGICREVRVFGIIEGFLVFGQVDEIELKRPPLKQDGDDGDGHPQTPTKSTWASQEEWRKEQARKEGAKKQITLSPSDAKTTRTLDSFFTKSQNTTAAQKGPFKTAYRGGRGPLAHVDTSVDGSKSEEASKPPAFLVVSDSKTRFSATVPRPESQTSAKLQCMLYRRMLEELCAGAVRYATNVGTCTAPQQSSSVATPEDVPRFIPCDIEAFLLSKKLDLHATLSDAFITASVEWCTNIGLFVEGEDGDNIVPRIHTIHALICSLADVVAEVRQTVTTSTLFGEELGLTYRHRATFKRKKTQIAFTRSQKTEPATTPRKTRTGSKGVEAAPVTPQRQKLRPRKSRDSEKHPQSEAEVAAAQQDLEEGLDDCVALDLRNEREGDLASDRGILSSPVKASQQDPVKSPSTPRKLRSRTQTPATVSPARSSSKISNVQNGLATPAAGASASTPSTPYHLEQQIIAKVAFSYDAAQLDAHLAAVMPVWLGHRDPVGVKELETYKCNSCEYRADCEWRAARAKEVWDRVRLRREAEEEEALWRQSGPARLGPGLSQDDADFLEELEKLENLKANRPAAGRCGSAGDSGTASRSDSGALVPAVASVALGPTLSPKSARSDDDSDAEYWRDDSEVPDDEMLQQIETRYASASKKESLHHPQAVTEENTIKAARAGGENEREQMPSSEADLWKGMLDDEALALVPSQ